MTAPVESDYIRSLREYYGDKPYKLLTQVWNHMHGINMDGTQRQARDDLAVQENWQKLSDAIGSYLEPGKKP